MSSLALALVILAAFIHASWNLIAKQAASARLVFVLAYTGIASVAYLPWVVWLLHNRGIDWTSGATACVLLSGALHLIQLEFATGLPSGPLAVVYPIARGSAPLSVHGRDRSARRATVSMGYGGPHRYRRWHRVDLHRRKPRKFRSSSAHKGVWWGAGTGAMIATYTVVDAYGVKVLAIHPVVLDFGANVVRLFALLPWLFSHRLEAATRIRDRWVLAVAVGVLSPLSYILMLFALRMCAPLSLVAPAREMSMMVGALLGMLILRERVAGDAWLAASYW